METNETVNQEETAAERTFTQAEVDAIVGERLKRDRARYADYDAIKEKADKLDQIEEARKTELQKATERANALQAELDGLKKAEKVRAMREKVAMDTGVPASLLTAETEDAAKEQAMQILSFARPGYQSVPDGGEVTKRSKATTRQQFADWFNSQT